MRLGIVYLINLPPDEIGWMPTMRMALALGRLGLAHSLTHSLIHMKQLSWQHKRDCVWHSNTVVPMHSGTVPIPVSGLALVGPVQGA